MTVEHLGESLGKDSKREKCVVMATLHHGDREREKERERKRERKRERGRWRLTRNAAPSWPPPP